MIYTVYVVIIRSSGDDDSVGRKKEKARIRYLEYIVIKIKQNINKKKYFCAGSLL